MNASSSSSRPCGSKRAFDLARIREPHARLTEKVEADVGLRDVLFEDRPVAHPFAKALREDERRIAEPEQVLEEPLVASHGEELVRFRVR
jgi:hypothetical protein